MGSTATKRIYSGLSWSSMYRPSTPIGAPPAEIRQYDGDHRTALPLVAKRLTFLSS